MADEDITPASGMGRLLSQSSLYLIGNIAAKAVGFVMIPFYARILSTAQYGVLNLLELATTVVSIAFGLQSVGTALTRVYHDQPAGRAQHRVVSTALLATVGLSGAVLVGACLAADPIAQAAGIAGQTGLLRLALLGMFTSGISEVLQVYVRMRGRARFILAYSMVALAATVGLNLLLMGAAGLGIAGFLLAKIIVTSIGSTVMVVLVVREVGLAWRTPLARAMARFAGPLVLSGGSYFAVHFSDRLFLAHVSRAEVGVYSMAYNFAFLLSVLVGDSFSKSWGVSVYGLAADEGWQVRFVGLGRWLILVLGGSAVGISLFGRDVLSLMVPAAYDPPALLLPLLVFGYFLREVGDFFNSLLLIGIGSGLVGRIAVAGALLNLALNAALIPHFGIWGAAWATFVTWAAYCAVAWIAAWRVHRVAMTPAALALMLLLSAAALAVRHALAPGSGVGALALDALVFAGFVGAVGLLYLRDGERAQVRDAVRKQAVLF